MPDEYVSPEKEADGFDCPHCEAFAHQKWTPIRTHYSPEGSGAVQIYDAYVGTCQRCDEHTFWVEEEMVYPKSSTAPKPVEDMPEEVKKDFNEARQVVEDSPRAAAALLRLAMEKLTKDLTGIDQSLYDNIGQLVDDGRIDERIQKALDAVRVAGNDYVHAGEIYEPDDRDTALRLFDLVNTIVQITITQEKLIEESYEEIPESKMEGINQRDK